MKKTALTLFLAVFSIACNDKITDTDALEKEVFAIHDEVMPRMGEIMSLKSNLTNEIMRIDSLLKIKADTELTSRKTKALELSTMLEKADVDMMDWMHNYNGDTLKVLSGEDGQKYLEGQKNNILIIKELTNKSIAETQAFLKK